MVINETMAFGIWFFIYTDGIDSIFELQNEIKLSLSISSEFYIRFGPFKFNVRLTADRQKDKDRKSKTEDGSKSGSRRLVDWKKKPQQPPRRDLA